MNKTRNKKQKKKVRSKNQKNEKTINVYLLKPLQYIIFFFTSTIINPASIYGFTEGEIKETSHILSIIPYALIMYIILKWISKYPVSVFGRIFVNTILICSTILAILTYITTIFLRDLSMDNIIIDVLLTIICVGVSAFWLILNPLARWQKVYE
ncbi:hypothetical protein [Cytobacillus sp. IB215316]|uniref:hypothetical protein n=1 Tax=Cytobacillus sp. IB215316 TaxID=3097354 RepID=UPI002A0C007A|nr:hypothetical protein [Cytobacillus sp. IB215316]MDX8361630.1 hypothetical protein [Cytobacillus sp. IB215316]